MPSAFEILGPLLQSAEPPLLGPKRRPEAWANELVSACVDELLPKAGVGGVTAQKVRALAFLWHDDLDASHAISQGLGDSDGSYLHGLMHRREPDFGNAAYWFRRVGKHPVFTQLARAVAPLPTTSAFKSRLIADNCWRPLAMIDACEAVDVEAVDAGDEEFLRQVQAIEFRLLLESFANGQRSSSLVAVNS